MDSLAKRLKLARERSGLTQATLATRAQVKQSDISKLERGVSLTTTGLVRLANALSVNPAWLDTGDGAMWPGSEDTPSFVAEPKVQYLAEKRPSGVILQLGDLLLNMDETDRKMAGAILADLVNNPGKAELMAAKFERILGGDRDSETPSAHRLGA